MKRLKQNDLKRGNFKIVGNIQPRTESGLEAVLASHMTAIGLDFEREHRFHPVRRWRFDFALVKYRIGIEAEGLQGNPNKKSRHTTISGYGKDCEKYNEAALLGWTVLRFTRDMIKSGRALQTIEQAILLSSDVIE